MVCPFLCIFFLFFPIAFAQSKQFYGPMAQAQPNENAKKMPTAPSRAQTQSRDKRFDGLESFAKTLSLLESFYVDPKDVPSDQLMDKAIQGMVSGLDPHTNYLSPAMLKEIVGDTSGQFAGVGVIIGISQRKLQVMDVITKSPAARAGILPGDIITHVDGIPCNGDNADEILNRLRGQPKTSVEITWTRGEQKPQKAVVSREMIKTSSVYSYPLASGYLYVRIFIFQEDTFSSLENILRDYEKNTPTGSQGILLDLRNNPGGLYKQAIEVSNIFINSGIIVSTIGRDKAKQEVEYAVPSKAHCKVPLLVMVNGGSASASEIVAGALQDHNRAIIAGTQTFGKGSVQTIVPLPNGAGLKMTIARYYTPKGRSIQARGIVPDISLAAENKTTPGGHGVRESQLTGHIDAADLQTADGEDRVVLEQSAQWPPLLKVDVELKNAYTFLRTWNRLNGKK